MPTLPELTLRDLFALFALQALAPHLEDWELAKAAYETADHMLVCRDAPRE